VKRAAKADTDGGSKSKKTKTKWLISFIFNSQVRIRFFW
jgi:hypothetical protein